MSHVTRTAAWVVLATACCGPALAEDYPFTGNFVSSGSPEAVSADDIGRCALSFFAQDKSGAFVNYVVDMDAFHYSQTLRYVITSRGQCAYVPALRLESCTTQVSNDPTEVGQTFVDVLDHIGADFVQISTFDNAADARDYATKGQSDLRSAAAFTRCPFDPARLAQAVTTEVTDQPARLTAPLIAPDKEFLHLPIVEALIKAAGMSKP